MSAMTTDHVTLEIVDGPNYARDEQGWEHHAYTLRLAYQEREIITPWRAGLGITDDPTARDVLDSMFSDASGYENSSDIDDWAAEYGYESISEAVRTYRAVEEQTAKLRDFLGDEFDDAIYSPADEPDGWIWKHTSEQAGGA